MNNATVKKTDTYFDDIRPYNADELPAAMQRIADSELIPSIANYLMPGADPEILRKKLRNIKNIYELQVGFLKEVIDILVQKTTTKFDWSGLENIPEKKPYLFVSNHRDIVLDAMFLQYILYIGGGHNTCQITFGSNLMEHPLVVDFGKANKMFRIERGGNRMEFYNNLMHTSEYMRHVITKEHESVWIAQRNGRTKDGIDATDPAIIKMFWMSRRDDKVKSLAELNIVPVAVSYEWESCDKLKTLELYATKVNGRYEKRPGEDLNSILTGIMQPKGHVHFHICKPVTEDDLRTMDSNPGDYFNNIAKLMDERINSGYMSMSNNFIANDLRSESNKYSSHYTEQQKADFLDYMKWIEAYKNLDQALLRDIFLGIYGNSVR